jgi:DNA invertase Pin-like site-specific DNA recombinase
MINKFKEGKADGLLVAHIDRITRNGVEAGLIVKLFVSGFIKEVRTPVKVYNTIGDILLLEIEFAMAGHFSRDLSVKVKEGIQTKLSKGEYPSYAPIGYINRNGKIYPDPKRSVYINEAYKLYASGNYSLQDLTDYLYKKGFRTRIQNKKVRTSVIHRILTDPIYYGAIRRNGNIYAGIHKALIDRTTFDVVQDILNGKDKGKKVDHTFMYRGYLYCDICLCKLTAALKKKKHIYYYCTNGKGRCYQHKKIYKACRHERHPSGSF